MATSDGGIYAYNDNIYMFSLYNSSGKYKAVYKYDILTDTYTQLSDMPIVSLNVAAGISNIVYLSTMSMSSNSELYKYDILTDTYTQLASFPKVGYCGYIYGAGNPIIGTDIYLFGGYINGTSNATYKYDTLTDTYTQLANIPYHFGGRTVINDKVYAFYSSSNGTIISVYTFTLNTGEPTQKQGLWLKSNLTPSEIITDDNVTLDPYWNTDKMSELKAIPYNFKYGSAVSIGTNIYLFGDNENGVIAYKYDTITDTYTRLTDIPYTFYSSDVISIGTDIYLFGSNQSDSRQLAYKYDTTTDTYTQLANIPYAFYQGGTVSIGTNIYLLGGDGGSTTAYKYNTLTDTYTRLANIPNTFASGSATSVGTDIYLFGDYNRKITAYKYDTLTDTYTQLTNIPYNFYSGSITAVGTDIYIFGGSGNTSSNSKITTYKYDTLTDTYTQLANIPYDFGYGSAINIRTDIYLLGGSYNPTKVQVLTFPTKNYTNNSIVIEKGSDYETDLISTNITNGLPYKFNNFYYYTTTGGLDNTIEKYYGNGTNWIQIT